MAITSSKCFELSKRKSGLYLSIIALVLNGESGGMKRIYILVNTRYAHIFICIVLRLSFNDASAKIQPRVSRTSQIGVDSYDGSLSCFRVSALYRGRVSAKSSTCDSGQPRCTYMLRISNDKQQSPPLCKNSGHLKGVSSYVGTAHIALRHTINAHQSN